MEQKNTGSGTLTPTNKCSSSSLRTPSSSSLEEGLAEEDNRDRALVTLSLLVTRVSPVAVFYEKEMVFYEKERVFVNKEACIECKIMWVIAV